MIILAFDTAMAGCSVAVYDAARDRRLAERFLVISRGHADQIAPLIRDVMKEAAIGFPELGRVGVTVGPGTFTGVRTGLAMARGLGLALGIPVIGIDTLTAIACNVSTADTPIAVAADARRGEVYYGLFDPDMTVRHAPVVLSVRETAKHLPDGPVTVLGTGAQALIDAARTRLLVRSNAGDLPRASAFIARMVAMKLPAEPPEPIYLRPPDAKPQERIASQRRTLSIESAGAGAASLLAALHAECFDNPWSAADITRLMATPGTIALLASQAGEPCAFLIARQAADEVEILTFGTRPYARLQGVARALFERLQSEIVQRGARLLFIEVGKDNEAALHLYRRLGFINAGVRRDYYEKTGGGREDAVLMRKDLAT